MEKLTINPWEILIDRAVTKSAYQEILKTEKYKCSCFHCKNFYEAFRKNLVFPQEILSLFDSFGIDPNGAAEIFHYNKENDGLHLYGGWYHFIGEIVIT